MTVDNNNNDIIVSENHNNIISNIIGVTECGEWNICYNETTGKQTYKPRDPNYYNK